MKKNVLIFLFDGYSDWEIAYLTPELNKSEQFQLNYVSQAGGVVTSMGGLQVSTSPLSEIDIDTIDMLVLPGGTAWEENKNREADGLTKACFEKNKPVAAICAATVYLARLGILDELKHTSNGLGYLKEVVPDYSGEANYQNVTAVTDQQVITANGTAPIEFAREVFKRLGLYNEQELDEWFRLFKHGILD